MLLRISEIKKETDELLKLRVDDSQTEFIEDIPTCLEEVRINSYGISWNPVGIFDDELLVGFAMYGMSRDNRVWLDRFMIGAEHQRKGYGKRALLMVLERICSTLKCETVYLSVHKNNAVAIKLYQDNGFCFIDELDGNAPVMKWSRKL